MQPDCTYNTTEYQCITNISTKVNTKTELVIDESKILRRPISVSLNVALTKFDIIY